MARDGLYENNPSGDLLRGVDLSRVASAVEAHRKALAPFRENLLQFTREHVGSFYGEGGLEYEVPLPLISTFLSIHSRALVAKEPRVNLSTFDRKMAPAVDAMESWENDFFEEIELGDTMRRVVHDALMTEGYVKVCLTMPEVAEAGYGQVGTPSIYQIDLDDWVCDMRARNYKEVTYTGHKYRIPLAVAKDIFRKNLDASEPNDYDEEGLDKLFTIGRGWQKQPDEFEDMIDLWEVHLRGRFNVVLTLLDRSGVPGGDKKDLLRVRKYLGPKGGNVFTLGFGTVSGNLRHKSPVMGIMPLHLAANRSYRKLIDTADNYKALCMVRGSAMGVDGKAIRDTPHMGIVSSDDPANSGEKRFNVPPAELQLFVQDLRAAFDYMAGGLATLGGRGAQTGTVGQEKILNENAGAGLSDMQGTVVSFVAQTIRCLNWYLWNHPEQVYETQKKVPGREDYFTRQLHPYNDELPSHAALTDSHALMREGKMPRIKVDPFSLAHTSPQQRSQFITAVMAEVAPYAAIAAQQGVVLDMGELLKLKAKYGDEPDLLKVFKNQGPPEPQAEGEGSPGEGGLNKEISVKPATTERIHTRQDGGGGGDDMAQQLMASASAGQGEGFA